jgi:hypothetical protein
MDVTTGSNDVLSETVGGCAEERRALFMIDFRCPEGVAILTAPQETNTPRMWQDQHFFQVASTFNQPRHHPRHTTREKAPRRARPRPSRKSPRSPTYPLPRLRCRR